MQKRLESDKKEHLETCSDFLFKVCISSFSAENINCTCAISSKKYLCSENCFIQFTHCSRAHPLLRDNFTYRHIRLCCLPQVGRILQEQHLKKLPNMPSKALAPGIQQASSLHVPFPICLLFLILFD